ncbi:MAG: hypothetical protein M1368_08435 [Thaumarchaeota archaeon]|nr:hypothetical protein [Nitrososphaerota archaeon]
MELNTSEKKLALESIKKELYEYLKLEEKLDSLVEQPTSTEQDPNLASERDILAQELKTRLRKIVDSIEQSGLVNEMPKEIESVYLELKSDAERKYQSTKRETK